MYNFYFNVNPNDEFSFTITHHTESFLDLIIFLKLLFPNVASLSNWSNPQKNQRVL
jgi:hypothetical protein